MKRARRTPVTRSNTPGLATRPRTSTALIDDRRVRAGAGHGEAASAGAAAVGWDRPRTASLLAKAAGLAMLAGAVTLTAALVAVPGPWTSGYVSEAGTSGPSRAVAYRGGVLLLAAGVALLATTLAPVARSASLLLLAAGLFAGVSGAVPCTDQCPLPPYEPTTVADVVHASAGILAMAACAFAMVAMAASNSLPSALRRVAGGAALVTFPLAVVQALAMLLVGRGPVSSAVERSLLIAAFCWLMVTAWLIGCWWSKPLRRSRPTG